MFRDHMKRPLWRTSRTQSQGISLQPNVSIGGNKESTADRDIGSLEEIFSLEDGLQTFRSDGDKRKNCWPPSHYAATKDGFKGPSDGRAVGQSAHCDCAWSKGQTEDKRLPHERNFLSSKSIPWTSSKAKISSRGAMNPKAQVDAATVSHKKQERKMIEEFVLDDNELCLFNFYDIPVDITKHYRMRKSAKLKTVSIIDTLSELALGATDREDDTGTLSSCTMTEPSIAPPFFSNTASSGRSRFSTNWSRHLKDSAYVSPGMGKDLPLRTTRESISKQTESGHPSFCSDDYRKFQRISLLGTNTSESEQENSATYQKGSDNVHVHDLSATSMSSPDLPLPYTGVNKILHSTNNTNTEPVPCNSLKRTLKYLRKAVSSTGVEGTSNEIHYTRGRRHHRKRDDKDYSRMCLSDSEVRHSRVKTQSTHGPLSNRGLRSKQKQVHSRQSMDFELLSGISQLGRNRNEMSTIVPLSKNGNKIPSQQIQKPVINSRQHSRVPEWIKRIFSVAKKGDLELLKTSLKDMDTALICNLSDHNGNNLWHICAAHNHLECLQWLCMHDNQDALVDENKGGLNPVVIAVKHGNLELTQWLVKHTSAITQIAPPEGTRSLLHYAAKYGHEKLCNWLTDYMEENAIDINRRDAGGNSSLHLAAKYGHIECTKCLILHGSDITARNELGMKPYNLAMCNGQKACADYIIAMEACFTLATEHHYLEADMQHLNMEGTELKNSFKELLSLTKRVIRRQQKIWESLQKIKNANISEASYLKQTEKSENNNVSKENENSWLLDKEGRNRQQLTDAWLEEYCQWLSEVIPDDKDRLHLIEENWRKVRRRQSRRCDDKSALDVIRTRFAQITCKATESHHGPEMRIMSSSETSISEESLPSEEDLLSPLILPSTSGITKTNSTPYSNFSPSSHEDVNPVLEDNTREIRQHLGNASESQVINDASRNYTERELQTINSNEQTEYSSDVHRKLDITTNPCSQHTVSARAVPTTSHSSVSSALRWDINLRLFFDRNPELRQEGKTCSVLEVLEPSSSENEEWIEKKKKKQTKSTCKEENWGSGNSSSSSMHSSTDCKLHSVSDSQTKTLHRTQVKNSDKESENTKCTENNEKSNDVEKQHSCQSANLSKSASSLISSEQNELLPCIVKPDISNQLHQVMNCQKISRNHKEIGSVTDDSSQELGTLLKKWESSSSITGAKILGHQNLVKNNSHEGLQLPEPDLIKGTQKINSPSRTSFERNEVLESNNKSNNRDQTRDYAADNNKDAIEASIPSTEEIKIRPEVEHALCVENTDKLRHHVEASNTPTNVKKKGFLLKFSLKGRWSSKQKPQTSKKVEEITPEEFRETYSRSAFPSIGGSGYISDVSHTSSQDNKIQDTVIKQPIQNPCQPKLNNETFQNMETKAIKSVDCSNIIKCSIDSSSPSKSRILPADYVPPPPVPLPLRREPPPIPILVKEERSSNEANSQQPDIGSTTDSANQENATANLSCSDTGVVTGIFQPPQVKMASVTPRSFLSSLSGSSHGSIAPWSPTLKSDSLSRPSSSASRLDSPPRSVDTYKSSFALHKDSSASTEMLLALDTSTAGRQSPAPSEVSKTESALSPPSDVSKTESTRHLNQLGRIEESTNIHRETVRPLTTFQENITVTTEAPTEVCSDKIEKESRSDSSIIDKTNIAEKSDMDKSMSKANMGNNTKRADSRDKPWYDVSDDDDMLTSHHFQISSVSVHSSSEDEAEGIVS